MELEEWWLPSKARAMVSSILNFELKPFSYFDLKILLIVNLKKKINYKNYSFFISTSLLKEVQ